MVVNERRYPVCVLFQLCEPRFERVNLIARRGGRN
jgi:hypothetical protein